MWGIGGDVSQFAAEDIARMIAQQQVQQQMQQQAAAAQQRAAMEQARLQLDQRQFDQGVVEHGDRLGMQNRQLEETAADRRDRANRAGVSDMNAQGEMLDKQANDQAIEAIAAQMPQGSGRRVIDLRRRGIAAQPDEVETPEERTTREAGDLTRIGKVAEIQASTAARHREPRQGPEPQYEWVTRDGKAAQIQRGTAQPGDTPYDAVANRTTNTGMAASQDRLRDKRLSAAQWSLDKLKELSSQINTEQGPGANVSGLVRRGKAAIGMDPIANEYRRIRNTAAMQFAVAIQGAAGLSNTEREALAQMIPPETVDNQTAMALFEDLNEMLQAMRGDPTGGASSGAPAGASVPSDPAGIRRPK